VKVPHTPLHTRVLIAALGSGLLVPLIVLNGAHADPRPDEHVSPAHSIPDADYRLSLAAIGSSRTVVIEVAQFLVQRSEMGSKDLRREVRKYLRHHRLSRS
jgi:hypothetical protein